ncbi:MAG: GNAT family N-acetyltransferase [Dehalococcoidia bacterium]
MRFLIDTNLIIKLEPLDREFEADADGAREFVRLIGKAGYRLLIHPAIEHDFTRDRDADRADRMRRLAEKYPRLQAPPRDDRVSQSLGRFDEGTNDWVDLQLIAAVDDGLVDYVVTEDQGLIRRLQKLGIRERGLTLTAANALLRSLTDEPVDPPARVERVLMHELPQDDPIWESFRAEYPDFDDWFQKARRDERTAWCISQQGPLAAVAIVKREDDKPHELTGRVLKISSFKDSEEFQGRRYGELLLRAVFDYAHANEYDRVYVTVFPHHERLIALFEDFGFFALETTTGLGEVVLAKDREPVAARIEDPLEYHVRYGPPAIPRDADRCFIVPIQPRFRRLLFPVLGDQAVLPLPELGGWREASGNALKKAYLSRTSSRLVDRGSILLFYESEHPQALVFVGVVEEVLVSRDVAEIRAFTSTRTVYANDEIAQMTADGDVLAILFRFDRQLDPPIALTELLEQGALTDAPRSVTSVRPEGLQWLKNQVLGPR